MRARKILKLIERSAGTDGSGATRSCRVACIIGKIESVKSAMGNMQERLTYLEKRYADQTKDLERARHGNDILINEKVALEQKLAHKDADLVRELQEAREDATCCRKRVEDVKRQLVESENTVNRIASLLKSKDLHQWAFTFLDRVRHPLVAEVYDLLQRAEMTEAKLKACQEANANINANCQRQIAEAKEPELTANQTEILLGIDKATEANVLRTTANNLAKKLFYLEKRYKDAAKTEREACADLIESSSSFILPDHDPDSWIKQFANTIRNRT